MFPGCYCCGFCGFHLADCQSGWNVTASIGVVTCIEICESYDALLGKVDNLMYVAKEKGKNAVEFATIGAGKNTNQPAK